MNVRIWNGLKKSRIRSQPLYIELNDFVKETFSSFCPDGCLYTFNLKQYCFAAGESIEVSGCIASAVAPADSCPVQKRVKNGPFVGLYTLKVMVELY